jgi:hypothetical protein
MKRKWIAVVVGWTVFLGGVYASMTAIDAIESESYGLLFELLRYVAFGGAIVIGGWLYQQINPPAQNPDDWDLRR